MKVAIIGASENVERYSHRAQRLLVEHGHTVFPISPGGQAILGQPAYQSVLDIPPDELPIDTVMLYVGPAKLAPIVDDIVALKPRRVIFNPGTESESAMRTFRAAGIESLEACTLVMLQTGQF